MASPDEQLADLRRRPRGGGVDAPVAEAPRVATLTVAAFDGEFGNRSYGVQASERTAFIVDPPREITPHLIWAASRGLRIGAVLETHLAGDYASGAREIEAATDATVVAPAAAGLLYPHRAVTDGSVVLIGEVEVYACAAPGHTDEHVAYVVTVDGTPAAVFGGGLLSPPAPVDFSDGDDTEYTDDDARVGEAKVATSPRLDLRQRPAPVRDQLARLPRDTPLYLTHEATAITTGDALDLITRADPSITSIEAGPHVGALRAINRTGARPLNSLPALQALTPRAVARQLREGAWLVDVRSPGAWTVEHVPQSISIVAGTEFRRLLPHAVPPGARVMLLAHPDDVDGCVRAARACGHDGLIGWVDGGWPAWRAAGLPTRSTPQASTYAPAWAEAFGSPEQTSLVLAVGSDVTLPDVAAGAVAIDDREVVVTARTGAEAALATSLLEARGHRVAIRLPPA